jgi:hypothetical protein
MLYRLIVAATLALLASAAHAETIRFAGYDWSVRDYPGGPGPNQWDPANVFVDEAGLHLRITQIGGVWSCAEVVLNQSLGFGTYSFDVTGRPDKYDPNVVLGLFTYPNSDAIGPGGTNEIDIELTRWGDKHNPNVINWTVYPPALGPKVTDSHFPMKLKSDASSHSFVWSSTGVAYAAYAGYADGKPKLIAKWNDAPAKPETRIPQAAVPLHMNLWLLNGTPPGDGKPVDIVIRGFTFTPE